MKFFLPLVTLLLGGLGAADLQAGPVDAYVTSVSGAAEFAPPDSGSYAPLHKGVSLAIGSKVRTGDDGEVILTTTPGSAVEIGHDSLLKITDLAFAKAGGVVTVRKALLELNAGEVSALVDPSTPQVTDFQIQTPQGAVAARGTFYSVAVKNDKTYVRVGEGKTAAIAKPTKGSI